MKFQMPFNSCIQIRLWEQVEVKDSPCHRLFDIIGVEYDTGRIDAICHAHASQFHMTRPVEEIENIVDGKGKEPTEKAEGEEPSEKTEGEEPSPVEEKKDDQAE